jgi:pimeloyl-ACP methyl ester carboxylesterase
VAAIASSKTLNESNIRHDRVRTSGVELHVARCGAGLPVILLHGFPGFWLVPELLDGIERFVPRLRMHRMPDVGHWVQNEAPDEVNRLLIAFLKRVGSRSEGKYGVGFSA